MLADRKHGTHITVNRYLILSKVRMLKGKKTGVKGQSPKNFKVCLLKKKRFGTLGGGGGGCCCCYVCVFLFVRGFCFFPVSSLNKLSNHK